MLSVLWFEAHSRSSAVDPHMREAVDCRYDLLRAV